MTRTAARAELDALDPAYVDRRGKLPSTPPPGDYVVIDVLHFSTTVIELFVNGAGSLHVPPDREGALAYKRSHPRAVVGGEPTRSYEPADGCDFFNSPSVVQGLDLEGHPVCFTSRNGGSAVAALREAAGTGVNVFVGSTTNAAALGRCLRRRDRRTILVGAGSGGAPAAEDTVGALLVARHLDDDPPTPDEIEAYATAVAEAKGTDYVERHAVRRRDVEEFATQFDSRRVVPTLESGTLVDAAARVGSRAST